MTKYIFVIQAFDTEKEDGTILNVVSVEVVDTNLGKAIARATKLVKKPHYRISSIIEKTK
jgi:hypothetical protein